MKMRAFYIYKVVYQEWRLYGAILLSKNSSLFIDKYNIL